MFKKTIAFLIIFSFLLAVNAFAAKKPTATLLNINSKQKMKPNGEYLILIKDKTWSRVANIPADRFLRELSVDLKDSIKKGDKVWVKIIKKGGAAAHIDYVSLGGVTPAGISGQYGPKTMKKLSQEDMDVTPLPTGGLEISFPYKALKSKELKMRARIESPVISKQAFKYPLSNTYRNITPISEFYNYRINSNRFALNVDKDLKKTGSMDEFFTEFARSGSGHPSAYTHGWVSNDDNYLYAIIDFTGDNTKDGDKDYAEVYAKVGDKIKKFRVSEKNTKWGKPHFTYTDRVKYEHKVYEFKIPFKELGIKSEEDMKNLKLAFATYGTDSPGDYEPDVAYDSFRNRYLIVYHNDVDGSDIDVYGQLVDHDGSLIGDAITIADTAALSGIPRVMFDSLNHRFVVVWADNRNNASNADIYGQIVNGDGSLNGENFAISENLGTVLETDPALDFDPVNGQFLVAYSSGSFPNTDLGARIINSDGTPAGAHFDISTAGNAQSQPSVKFNSSSEKFLVVWHDSRSGLGRDVWGRLIDPDGTPTAAEFSIAVVAGQFQRYTDIALNTSNGDFLVAFEDDRTTDNIPDIWGQLLDKDGNLEGSNFEIASDSNYDFNTPATVFNPSMGQYIVTWTFAEKFGAIVANIYSRSLSPDTVTKGDAGAISESTKDQYEQRLATNSNCPNSLVAFERNDDPTFDIGFIVFGEACSDAPGTPELLSPENGATGLSTPVKLKWKKSTDPDGDTVSYDVYVCENESMAGCEPEEANGTSSAGLNPLLAILIIGALPMLFLRRKFRYIGIALMITGFIGLAGCGSSSLTYTAEDLNASTKYYWKVVAKDGGGGIAHSETWSFTTK